MSKSGKIILIVCGVFIVCGICLILLIPALPSRQKTSILTHQKSAFVSLRVLNSAEGEYAGTYPKHGFACSVAELGGDPASGPPTPQAAQIIGGDMASGHKAGYTFVISDCAKKTVDNHDELVSYKITAVPDRVGRTGNLGYCTDESGEIRFDPKGGTNCTELLQ